MIVSVSLDVTYSIKEQIISSEYYFPMKKIICNQYLGAIYHHHLIIIQEGKCLLSQTEVVLS